MRALVHLKIRRRKEIPLRARSDAPLEGVKVEGVGIVAVAVACAIAVVGVVAIAVTIACAGGRARGKRLC